MTRLAPTDPVCPLTVIGGFLGAGKTTLVNRLLAAATGRFAVLVNDFGAVNVDADLILSHDGETLRLTNGCVCCSMADDFMATLIRVLDAPEPFDHIVIEASGVGDPWTIAEIALVEPQVFLHAVLVLADAERICALLDDPRLGDMVKRQIEAADLVLLNKIDLVDRAASERATDRLLTVKPNLRVVSTVGALVPDELLDVGHLQRVGSTGGRTTTFRAEAVHHESLFHRILYRRDGAFDQARLDAALRDLPASLLRLKGTCAIDGAPSTLLQLVAQRWSLTPAGPDHQAGFIELVGIAAEADASALVADRLDAALARASHTFELTPAVRHRDLLLRDVED